MVGSTGAVAQDWCGFYVNTALLSTPRGSVIHQSEIRISRPDFGPDHRRLPGRPTERARRRLRVILGPGGGWGRSPSLARTRRRSRRRQNHRSPNLQGRVSLLLVRQVGRRRPTDFRGRRDGRARRTCPYDPRSPAHGTRRTPRRVSPLSANTPTSRPTPWGGFSGDCGRSRRRCVGLVPGRGFWCGLASPVTARRTHRG